MMKKNNEKGFTLAELLIVVAIIAVLVAVSLPIFTAQLEKSREATDLANLRAAKAEAVAIYLLGDTTNTNDDVQWRDPDDPSKGFEAYYNADEGRLTTNAAGIVAYGKGTSKVGSPNNTGFDYNPAEGYVNKFIHVVVDDEGVCHFDPWAE